MQVARLLFAGLLLFASAASAQNMDPMLVARAKEYQAAVQARDAAKIASFYTEDAVTFGQWGVVKGQAAIRRDFESEIKRAHEMSIRIVDATTSGDLGYVFGTFSVPNSANRPGRAGTYLEVWKRVDGQWLIAYDTASNDPLPLLVE